MICIATRCAFNMDAQINIKINIKIKKHVCMHKIMAWEHT